jgi:hypothetical protein
MRRNTGVDRVATKILTPKDADRLGLTAKNGAKGAKKRANPHVQEIMAEVKGAKPGQFLIYDPDDNRGYQTQVLRVRQAFDLLEKPWPFSRPLDGGKRLAMKILSRKNSFEKYPQQPLAPKREKARSSKSDSPAG